MSQPFLGEVKIISWNFAPKGWALCNGQFLPINQNQALFSLFGTMYGGNGQTTFALPDLRGRTPLHVGQGFTQGERAGQEFHTLIQSEMPAHNHFLQASNTDANSTSVSGNALARTGGNLYVANVSGGALGMQAGTVTNVGGSQPHENRQPFLVVNMIVALIGIFPSQN